MNSLQKALPHQSISAQVEAERAARSKSDRLKSELQRELEELSERLDEAGGQTSAQVKERNKMSKAKKRFRLK